MKVKKVYIIGAGSSLAIATFLSHYFSLVFDSVQLISATSEAQILQQMVHIGEGDALIGISFPRDSKKAVKALKYASDRGATVVANYGQHAFSADEVCGACAACKERHGFIC